MSPLRGVVIETGAVLVVRLKSGAKLRIPEDERFVLGDVAWVLYDYTRGRVRKLWTNAQYYHDGDPGEEPEEVDMGEDWVADHEWLRRACL